jgi:hypothetical protein
MVFKKCRHVGVGICLGRIYDSSTRSCTKALITSITVTVLPPDVLGLGWYFFTNICHKTGTSPKPCISLFLPLSPLPHPASFKTRELACSAQVKYWGWRYYRTMAGKR